MHKGKEIKPKDQQRGLSPLEESIISKNSGVLIRDLPDTELSSNVSSLALGISKMVGIKNIDEIQVTLFYDFLKKYFNDMTLSEVKLAFELSVTGELNGYLEKDHKGKPDANHYQMFSMEYVSKVLTAYRKRRNRIKINIKKLPGSTFDHSKVKNDLIDRLVKEFREYRDEHKKPSFIIPFVHVRRLQEVGLLMDIEEPTEQDKKDMLNNIFEETGSKEAMEFYRLRPGFLHSRVSRKKYYNAIIELFNRLIEQNKDLGEYFYET